MRNFVCRECGATNVGIQTTCLICGAGIIPAPPVFTESHPFGSVNVAHESASIACPACGAKNSPDARFCGSCGDALSQVQYPERHPRFCKKCGAAIRENSRFCTRCGASTST